MFRILCYPSSGSMKLYLTEIIRSGSQMFVACLFGVWQRNFKPVVCVYGPTGWARDSNPVPLDLQVIVQPLNDG